MELGDKSCGLIPTPQRRIGSADCCFDFYILKKLCRHLLSPYVDFALTPNAAIINPNAFVTERPPKRISIKIETTSKDYRRRMRLNGIVFKSRYKRGTIESSPRVVLNAHLMTTDRRPEGTGVDVAARFSIE